MAGRKSTKRKNPSHIGWQKPTASQKKWGVDLVGYTNDNYCYEIESETVRGTEYHEVYIMPPAGSFGGGVREKVGTRGTLALAKALAESNYERMAGNRANPRARRNPLTVNPEDRVHPGLRYGWFVVPVDNTTKGGGGPYRTKADALAASHSQPSTAGAYKLKRRWVKHDVRFREPRMNPLTVNPFKTMSEVRGAHKAAGLHFFDKGAGKMFGEVALKGPYRGHYVVSQQVLTFGDGIPRRKGVVSYFADDGSKRHVKTFEGPSSWTDAVDFAKGKGEVRSNPRARKNPMGDTWAIMSAADVMRANPRKSYGTLCDYHTGNRIRKASAKELSASKAAAKMDGGAGVILCAGRACYVEGH